MFGDLGLDDIEICGRRFGTQVLGAEVDFDHAATVSCGRERMEGRFDPLCSRIGEIEVKISPLGDALAAEGGQALVDRFADGAEFNIGGVAEGEHAELDAIEARSFVAHEVGIGARGAGGRIAFAPGRGDHDQAARAGQGCDIKIGHVDDRGLEALLACGLGHVVCKLFAVAGFAREHDGQRFGRARRGGGLRSGRRCVKPGQKAGEPGALDLVCRSHHAIEDFDFVLGERRGLWNGGGGHGD